MWSPPIKQELCHSTPSLMQSLPNTMPSTLPHKGNMVRWNSKQDNSIRLRLSTDQDKKNRMQE